MTELTQTVNDAATNATLINKNSIRPVQTNASSDTSSKLHRIQTTIFLDRYRASVAASAPKQHRRIIAEPTDIHAQNEGIIDACSRVNALRL